MCFHKTEQISLKDELVWEHLQGKEKLCLELMEEIGGAKIDKVGRIEGKAGGVEGEVKGLTVG